MKVLQLEHPVDEHLKPLKTEDVNTSLEISTDKIRVKDLEVTGSLVNTNEDILLAGANLKGRAGFKKETAEFSTSEYGGGDTTDVDFRLGNKVELTLTDDIAGSGENINLIFPAVSGNFLLVLVQGNATCTVHSDGWKARNVKGALCKDNLGTTGTEGEVRWAGGTPPTLTTTQYKSDIISIYWDADNETACTTASLNF